MTLILRAKAEIEQRQRAQLSEEILRDVAAILERAKREAGNDVLMPAEEAENEVAVKDFMKRLMEVNHDD